MTEEDLEHLPNFIIGGAQKSGTTSLHRYLESHPEVFLPLDSQETHFFDTDDRFNSGLVWYRNCFREARRDQVIGETSPLYLFMNNVPQRIRDTLPTIKLIFILRNPVDRAYSHYWHQFKMAGEPLSFERAIDAEPSRLARGTHSLRAYSYLARGRYVEQVIRYLELFKLDQMTLLTYEEFSANPRKELQSLCRFIGVDPGFPFDTTRRYNKTVIPRSRWFRKMSLAAKRRGGILAGPIQRIDRSLNMRHGIPPMAPDTRARLLEHFRPYNEELASRVPIDIDPWGV